MKPIVQYIDLAFCVVGCPAVVLPFDHPGEYVSNRTWAKTTPVESIDWRSAGPVLETLNTIYVPVESDGESVAAKTNEVTA